MSLIFKNDYISIEIENSEIPWLKIFANSEVKEFSQCDSKTKEEILKYLEIIEKEMISFFNPEKINIASFGNYVPKVHFHIMARFKQDSFFPEPMWGKKQREGNLDLNLEDFYEKIKEKF